MTAHLPDVPMRVRPRHVEWVAERTGPRDRAIIDSINRLRLASSAQLERLHFADLAAAARARIRRRVLARLVAWRVLLPLERRIGGVRAGSAGLVFALDSAGQQLAAGAGGARRPREPSRALLGHSLAVSELYVTLVEQSRSGKFAVAEYRTEPACWWPLPHGGWLKPDAYLKLTTTGFDDHWWIEVDKDTEHLPTLRRKLSVYLDFARSGGLGPSGVLPRVLVTVPNEPRAAQVQQLISRLPDADGLLHVVTETWAPTHLIQILRS